MRKNFSVLCFPTLTALFFNSFIQQQTLNHQICQLSVLPQAETTSDSQTQKLLNGYCEKQRERELVVAFRPISSQEVVIESYPTKIKRRSFSRNLKFTGRKARQLYLMRENIWRKHGRMATGERLAQFSKDLETKILHHSHFFAPLLFQNKNESQILFFLF